MTDLAACFEKLARRVDIDRQAKVEIVLGLPADDGGEVEYGGRFFVDDLRKRIGVADVGRHHVDPRIVESKRGHDVEQGDLVNLFFTQFGIFQRSALQQPGCQPPSQKPGAPRNQNLHHISLSHPKPSSVRPRGLYSQPTQPS